MAFFISSTLWLKGRDFQEMAFQFFFDGGAPAGLAWVPFPDDAQQALVALLARWTTSGQDPQAGRMQVTIRGNSYDVDLSGATQTNTASGMKRRICAFPAGAAPPPAAAPAPGPAAPGPLLHHSSSQRALALIVTTQVRRYRKQLNFGC